MNYATTGSPLIRVSRKHPCPVCGKPDNCNVSTDGRIAYCRRVRGDRQGRDGGWTHFLTNDPPLTRPQPARQQERHSVTKRADEDHITGVLTTLLRKHLTLSPKHAAALQARGLTLEEIKRNGYRTAPNVEQGCAIASELADYDLEGVPGFYRDGGKWRMVHLGAGFYVPVRAADGFIRGMQLRRDEGKPKYLWFSSNDKPSGTSSGAPVHFAYHHLLREAQEVVLTEGALKADCIAYLTQAPVIGIAGVSNFGADFAARLRATAPQLRLVRIAYDRDLLEKEQVYEALLRLTRQLEDARFRVRIRTWKPPEKGFDDYLLSQLRQQGVAA